MFAKHNAPELNRTHCSVMETLRASIEIFTGLRVKYEDFNFRRSKASIIIAGQSRPVCFNAVGVHVDWCFNMGNEKPNEWLSTTQVDDGLHVYFQMMCNNQVRFNGHLLDCDWFGQDHINREIQFLYPEHAAFVAGEAGMTMAELHSQVTALITSQQSLTWK